MSMTAALVGTELLHRDSHGFFKGKVVRVDSGNSARVELEDPEKTLRSSERVVTLTHAQVKTAMRRRAARQRELAAHAPKGAVLTVRKKPV